MKVCRNCHKSFDENSEENLTAPWRITMDCEDFCSDECRTEWLFK
jgi:hypothetical protein